MQHSQIYELMLYKFAWGYNTENATKSICCKKGEGAVVDSCCSRNFARAARTSRIREGQVHLKT